MPTNTPQSDFTLDDFRIEPSGLEVSADETVEVAELAEPDASAARIGTVKVGNERAFSRFLNNDLELMTASIRIDLQNLERQMAKVVEEKKRREAEGNPFSDSELTVLVQAIDGMLAELGRVSLLQQRTTKMVQSLVLGE